MCSGSFDEKASGASSLESPLSPTPVVRLLDIHRAKLGLTQENLSAGFGNNKGADHFAHLLCLISTFIIHSVESVTA